MKTPDDITVADWERARQLLCALQNYLLETIIRERAAAEPDSMHAVSDVTEADTIYAIDKISETAILEWFGSHWPVDWPVEIVMEGLENHGAVTFPETITVEATVFKCIIDPIDGTRPIMYDKRAAWALTGLAPQRGKDTCLQDIVVGAMTELPTTKQWRADQLSAIKGGELFAESINVRSNTRTPLAVKPSSATDVEHGFSAVNRFFPDGLVLLAEIEAELWRRVAWEANGLPVVFSDQYLTTGGQLYEVIVGHDRFLADLRPWAFRHLGLGESLCCHPYDIGFLPVCAAAGILVEDPITRAPLRAPLDTTTAVGWAAYANAELRALISPHLHAVLKNLCPNAFG